MGRIEKRAIDDRAACVDMTTNAISTHALTLAPVGEANEATKLRRSPNSPVRVGSGALAPVIQSRARSNTVRLGLLPRLQDRRCQISPS